jgi:hypothetical protein
MRRPEVIAWVLSVATGRRRSQAQAPAALTAAALPVGRAALAALGRHLAGGAAAEHRIERAWRPCADGRVEVGAAMAGVVDRRTRRRRKPLPVARGWGDGRPSQTRMAAAVRRGRAVPRVRAGYPGWRLFRSRNGPEGGLVRLLRSLVPDRVRVIPPADRGSGRAEFARPCRQIGVSFAPRTRPGVRARHRRYAGRPGDLPSRPGCRRTPAGAGDRGGGAVTVHVAARWGRGLPPKRDEPWPLMTGLSRNAVAVSDRDAKRMTVEELFRGGKSKRNGLARRLTRVTAAGRRDRRLPAPAPADIPLTGLGAIAQARHRPGAWRSSNDPGQGSVSTIGRVMLGRMSETPDAAWRAVVAGTAAATPKWG